MHILNNKYMLKERLKGLQMLVCIANAKTEFAQKKKRAPPNFRILISCKEQTDELISLFIYSLA